MKAASFIYSYISPTHLLLPIIREDGTIELLTKGDNNRVGDRGLYAPGQLWLNREDILGRAAGYVLGVGGWMGGCAFAVVL